MFVLNAWQLGVMNRHEGVYEVAAAFRNIVMYNTNAHPIGQTARAALTHIVKKAQTDAAKLIGGM